MTNCACGCFGDITLNNTVPIEKENDSRPRKNTASTASLSDNEKADGDTESDTTNQSIDQKTKTVWKLAPEESQPDREEFLTFKQLPSGLSVESEDHLFDEAIANENSSLLHSYLPPPVPVMACDV